MQDDLRAIFTYNRWANGLIVETVRRLAPHQYIGEPSPGWTSVRATLVHLADATWIWARRLQGETVISRMTEAEMPDLEEVVRYLDRGHDAFDRLLETLSPERLGAIWSYRNIEGKEFRVPLWAVYRHVVNHATYHRGQVASKLKRFAIDPPATDFVLWAIAQTPQG